MANEKYWMHWKVSKRLYKFVRPTMIFLKGQEILDWTASECYDETDIAVFCNNFLHRRVEELLQSYSDALSEVEAEVHKDLDKTHGTVGEFLAVCGGLDIDKVSLVVHKDLGDGKKRTTFRGWDYEDMFGWSAEEDRAVSDLKVTSFKVKGDRLTIYAEG